MTYELIINDRRLNEVCDQFSQCSVIAVDTEFKRESTYFPIPCLFQLASNQLTVCIDPLEIEDLSPLNRLFLNENVVKIFHAGRQDLEIFYYLFQELPKPIFDTQIAAGILGFPAQVGYAKLVMEYLDIELDKSLTRADWERRPLPLKQLEYAANDVIYLLQVYEKQIDALNKADKLDWPNDDCEALLDITLYRPDPKFAWTRIRNYQYLSTNEKKIAAALAQWREELAVSRNRPRKFIFDNPIITEISVKQPLSIEALTSLENIPAFVKRKYASQMIAIVKEALNSDTLPVNSSYTPLTEDQSKQVKVMQKLIKEVSENEKIDATFICSKKEIEKMIQGSKTLPVLKGWRYNLVGKKLSELMI